MMLRLILNNAPADKTGSLIENRLSVIISGMNPVDDVWGKPSIILDIRYGRVLLWFDGMLYIKSARKMPPFRVAI